MVKAKKKLVKKDWLGEESKPTSNRKHMQLGDSNDMARKESFGVSALKPDYKSENNMFAFVTTEWETVQEHWVNIDGSSERIVCPVMAVADETREEKIDNNWGYPDGCDLCKTKKDLYEGHPKDSKDRVDKMGRDIAGRASARKSHYLKVVKGNLVKFKASRKSNKIVTEPEFDEAALVGKPLKLTDDAFSTLFKAIREAGYTVEQLVGMPFNLVGGRKSGNAFVIDRVDFYPKQKLKKLPKNKISFDGLAVFDKEKYEKVYKEFKVAVPEWLSGRKKLADRFAKVKPKAKSKAKTRKKR